MDVTILKLDLGDAEFNAPFATGGDGEESDDEESDDEEPEAVDTSETGAGLRPVAAVAVLAGLAVLGWYLRSGDESAETEADELEIEES